MMEISVLASGSNGNCCLIEDKDDSILIDAGKSCREIEKRMKRLGKSPEQLAAILISHSHADHIAGAGVISRKYKIPMYVTKQTYNEILYIGRQEIRHFFPGKEFQVGQLNVMPIQLCHDVASCGFVINNFGIFTDTGKATKQLMEAMPKLKGVLIESNHDIEMLIKGPYPQHLKYRILGDFGHLSNIHASQLVKDKGKNLHLCLLGHLSATNNTADLCRHTFETIVQRKVDYSVLSRECESGSWEI